MAVEKLTLAGLGSIDNGKVGAMFMAHLRKCVEDINDRPGDHTARTVTLTMQLQPTGSEGVVEDVKASFLCKSNVPANRTREYSMEPDGRGQLLFNDASKDNVRQRTLDDAAKEGDQ